MGLSIERMNLNIHNHYYNWLNWEWILGSIAIGSSDHLFIYFQFIPLTNVADISRGLLLSSKGFSVDQLNSIDILTWWSSHLQGYSALKTTRTSAHEYHNILFPVRIATVQYLPSDHCICCWLLLLLSVPLDHYYYCYLFHWTIIITAICSTGPLLLLLSIPLDHYFTVHFDHYYYYYYYCYNYVPFDHYVFTSRYWRGTLGISMMCPFIQWMQISLSRWEVSCAHSLL